MSIIVNPYFELAKAKYPRLRIERYQDYCQKFQPELLDPHVNNNLMCLVEDLTNYNSPDGIQYGWVLIYILSDTPNDPKGLSGGSYGTPRPFEQRDYDYLVSSDLTAKYGMKRIVDGAADTSQAKAGFRKFIRSRKQAQDANRAKRKKAQAGVDEAKMRDAVDRFMMPKVAPSFYVPRKYEDVKRG